MLVIIFSLLQHNLLFSMQSGDAKQMIVEANTAFENERYDEAILKYEQLAVESYASAALFHNLGLSYFKKDELALSILYLEKAKRIRSRNAIINHNLRLINENVDSEILELPDFFLKAWYIQVFNIGTLLLWVLLHLLFLIAACIFLYLILLKNYSFGWHNSYTKGIIIALFALSLLFAAFAYSKQKAINRNDVAVVMKDNTALRISATDNSPEVQNVNQGVKVVILDQIDNYLKVRLMDYTEAWIVEDVVRRI